MSYFIFLAADKMLIFCRGAGAASAYSAMPMPCHFHYAGNMLHDDGAHAMFMSICYAAALPARPYFRLMRRHNTARVRCFASPTPLRCTAISTPPLQPARMPFLAITPPRHTGPFYASPPTTSIRQDTGHARTWPRLPRVIRKMSMTSADARYYYWRASMIRLPPHFSASQLANIEAAAAYDY